MGHSCRKSTTANQIMSLSSNKMRIVPLLLLIAPAALAAPMSAEDSGEEDFDNLILSRAGEFGDSGEDQDFEDFDNLTLSRAAEFEGRAINTCDCAPVSSSDRIVGGKEVNPKYKLPYQVLVSPCASNGGCLMCGGTILNKRYVVTAAHCLYNGNTEMTLKGGAKFRVMVGEHDHCKHNEAGGKNFVMASVVHKHPKYDINSAAADFDIAILKLSKDLTFSNKIWMGRPQGVHPPQAGQAAWAVWPEGDHRQHPQDFGQKVQRLLGRLLLYHPTLCLGQGNRFLPG